MHIIEQAFRKGREVILPWNSDKEKQRVSNALSILKLYLASFKPEASFGGTNNLNADRQSFWVASTGLNTPLHTEAEDLLRFDGDEKGGQAGLEALRIPHIAHAIHATKEVLDRSLALISQALDLPEEATIRYRIARYEALERDVAGIGWHPDGNVLSALITDRKGLVVMDGTTTHQPPTNGIILMPGSILTRWSEGAFPPTFHQVEVPRRIDADSENPTKVSVVAFYNFPDQTYVPKSAHLGQSGTFFNDVQKFKEDDMKIDGDMKPYLVHLGNMH